MARAKLATDKIKRPRSVSLDDDQFKTFCALGGSRWLQNEMDKRALGMAPRKTKASEYVRMVYPHAVCRRDPTDGRGVSYGIYIEFADRSWATLTKGWMTPAQAWERMAARLKGFSKRN